MSQSEISAQPEQAQQDVPPQSHLEPELEPQPALGVALEEEKLEENPAAVRPVDSEVLRQLALAAISNAGGDEENAGDGEIAQHTYNAAARRKSQYEQFRSEFGQEHRATLLAGLEYFNQLIQLYKLSECDTLLDQIYSGCSKAGGDLYIKCIQAFAFLRYKQFRIEEAIKYFEEMEGLVGPSAALLENMGHAYNNAGMEAKAETCFRKALGILKDQQLQTEKEGRDSSAISEQRGGSLLGLGVLYLHKSRTDQALEVLLEGLEAYRSAHKNDHSIVAKASMYVGDAYRQGGNLLKAEEMYKETVRIFRVTCGSESPLTCTALNKHGQALLALSTQQAQLKNAAQAQKYREEAIVVLEEAFMRTCLELDIHSIRLSTVSELLIILYNTRSASAKNQYAARYTEWCDTVLDKLNTKYNGQLPKDGNSAVFFKTYAELCILAGKMSDAIPLFAKAISVLEVLKEPQAAQLLNDCTLCLNMLLRTNQHSQGASSSSKKR